jgi:hypothetical protein
VSLEQWRGDEMDLLVSFLNNDEGSLVPPEERAEFLELLTQWKKSGEHWGRFLQRYVTKKGFVSFANGQYFSDPSGPEPAVILFGGETQAQGIFFTFVRNPDRWRLCGPCRRKECLRYFLRKTTHEKVYCSNRCATRDSALVAMRAKRKEIRDRLVQETKKAVARWERKPLQKIAWSDWVAAHVTTWAESVNLRQKEVTARMIHGWVLSGYVTPPRKIRTNAKK